MGASGWDYVVPFSGNIEEAFGAVRQQVLDSGDYLWNYGPDGRAESESEAVRPTTLAEVDAFKEIEDFWDEGSHSILDIDHVIDAAAGDQVGAIRPLTADEVQRHFKTAQPTRADFDTAYQRGMGPLSEANPLRWSGRCTVLYDGASPSAVAFWGFSGD